MTSYHSLADPSEGLLLLLLQRLFVLLLQLTNLLLRRLLQHKQQGHQLYLLLLSSRINFIVESFVDIVLALKAELKKNSR